MLLWRIWTAWESVVRGGKPLRRMGFLTYLLSLVMTRLWTEVVEWTCYAKTEIQS